MARDWLNAMMLATAVCAATPIVSLGQAVTETSPGAAVTASTTPSARPLPEAIQSDIQQLGQTINDPVATQGQRDEAARRLTERATSAAMAQLRAVLTDTSNVRGQIAVAAALADNPPVDESFVDPLTKLLGGDVRLAGAVASALAAYKDNPEALRALVTFARNAPAGADARQREAARIAVIGALGLLTDKRAAAALVELQQSDLESEAIRAAAAEALGVLTGHRDWGRDGQRWSRWWAEAGQQNDTAFRAAVLASRANRSDVLSRREQALATRLRLVMSEQYLAMPRAQKDSALAKYLSDDSPTVRALGASLVGDDARGANAPSPATRERMRTMVGDSDPAVRIEVALTLRAVNDREAIEPLRVQLAQETHVDALMAQLVTLGFVGDARAAGSILPFLDSPSDAIALVAVRAMGQLGATMRETDPAAATEARTRLVAVLRGRAAKAGAETLRAATVTALAPIADASLTPTFIQLLNPREARTVRVAALNAMAVVGDPKAADRLSDLFDPATTEREVRLAAVRTMGSVGSFDYVSLLLRRMNRADEPDDEIRAAASASVNRVLPSGDKRGLKQLADQFRQNPALRLSVLKVLVDKLQQEGRQPNDSDLALEQQNLGEVQAQVGQHREAAGSFKAALDFWVAQNQPAPAVVETLIGQYLQSLLKSVQYPEAARFATDTIGRDTANMPTVFQEVRREADALRTNGDLAGALRLVGTFKGLRLGPYNNRLEEMERDLQQELNAKTNTRPSGNATVPDHREYFAIVQQRTMA
ncbi:MAG TPA: HEAT repeat domain-containing protein [Tepidisphaeraceae bacterium]|jgi:HEAT repeat protein|nr:HEAT repeat domain-containing protein [Tepidisphaeraceae bacterium]